MGDAVNQENKTSFPNRAEPSYVFDEIQVDIYRQVLPRVDDQESRQFTEHGNFIGWLVVISSTLLAVSGAALVRPGIEFPQLLDVAALFLVLTLTMGVIERFIALAVQKFRKEVDMGMYMMMAMQEMVSNKKVAEFATTKKVDDMSDDETLQFYAQLRGIKLAENINADDGLTEDQRSDVRNFCEGYEEERSDMSRETLRVVLMAIGGTRRKADLSMGKMDSGLAEKEYNKSRLAIQRKAAQRYFFQWTHGVVFVGTGLSFIVAMGIIGYALRMHS